MAEHTPTPWFRNGKCEVGPRPRTDDQSDGMLHPVADVFGDNAYADSAFIVQAVNAHHQLTSAVDLLEQNAGIQAKLLADTARERDALVKALERARNVIEIEIEIHGPDHTGLLLSVLNEADRTLAAVGGARE